MKIERSIHDEDSRSFWEFVDAAAKKVAEWPAWMRGGPFPEDSPPERNSDKNRASSGIYKATATP